MNEVEILKLEALSYWRFERQHIIGAIECQNADVKTMTKAKMLAETEVKVSIADMQCEIKTKGYKHRRMGNKLTGLGFYRPEVHYFYFLVPLRLKDRALEICNNLYPYAGLLVLAGEVKDLYCDKCIKSVKPAKRLNRDKATEDEIIRLAYGATNTAIRYGNKYLPCCITLNKKGGRIE